MYATVCFSGVSLYQQYRWRGGDGYGRFGAGTEAERLQIVDFETTLFTAQVFDSTAGLLTADGGQGGPARLSTQPFLVGINDLTVDPSTTPQRGTAGSRHDALQALGNADAHLCPGLRRPPLYTLRNTLTGAKNARCNIGLSDREHADLVAFLRTL